MYTHTPESIKIQQKFLISVLEASWAIFYYLDSFSLSSSEKWYDTKNFRLLKISETFYLSILILKCCITSFLMKSILDNVNMWLYSI